MKLSNFWKGFIMTLITLLATAISTTGLPTTMLAWEILGITGAGTLLVYMAKNAAFPSTSLLGEINLRDLLSGLFMAVGSGLSSWAASYVSGTTVNWASLTSLMVMTGVGYIAKTVLSTAPKESPTLPTSAPRDSTAGKP